MIDTYYDQGVPLFAALLTDFHNTDPAPVLRSLEANKPQVILIAGDLIYGDDPDKHQLNIYKNRNSIALLQGCSGIAPVFMSLGNHEWMLTKEDLDVIRETGTVVLDNSSVSYEGVVIGGLSSAFYSAYQALRRANPGAGLFPVPIYSLKHRNIQPDTAWLPDFEREPGYKILLCHHPEYYPRYLQHRNIDLVLSGHAHGGQWRFYDPFRKEWRGVFAPGQGLFPALTSGVHGNLVISRGLSNPTPLPRINNPEEIIYFRQK